MYFSKILILLVIYSKSLLSITISVRKNMDFGKQASGATEIVTLSDPPFTGGQLAKFKIRKGTPNSTIIVDFPSTTISGPSSTIVNIDNFTPPSGTSFTLNGKGRVTISNVGASAYIESSDPMGTYFGLGTIRISEDGGSTWTTKTFNINLELLSPISITVNQDLVFPAQFGGLNTSITVSKNDPTAASFTVTGASNARISVDVLDTSINMTDGNTNILVDNFTGTGNKRCDASGSITFGIGATAHITTTNQPGSYIGTQTLRIVYR